MAEDLQLQSETLFEIKDIPDEHSKQKDKRKIIKNVILLSSVFLLLFNAYQGLARLQSSLHDEQGLGVITQSVLYTSLLISSFLLPNLVITQLGHKWTIVVCIGCYMTWVLANGYATWATMIITSVIVGLAAAPLWTAKCAYLTLLGVWYSKLSGESQEAVISRFFGIFFMLFQLASVTGSVISSTILKTQHNDSITYDTSLYCGVNYCPWSNVTHLEINNPSSTTVWTLLTVYILLACIAIAIMAIFVDPLPRHLLPENVNIKDDILNVLLDTVKQMKHKVQILIIPLTIYGGFEQGFFNIEFTQSFVTCSLGIWKVGLVTLPYGVTNMFMSFTVGYMVKYVGRIPIVIAGIAVDLCIQFTLMFRSPTPDLEYLLFILSAMWGFTDAVWQTQINGFYGQVFSSNTTAAFANYKVWECIGFILAFVCSPVLCTNVKTYMLTLLLVPGAIAYFIAEYNIRQSKK